VVNFSWSVAYDDETPADGLTYNLRLGTFPGGNNVAAPMADGVNGYRLIPSNGNMGHITSWLITDLLPGTYYWSVQAIDQAMEGSAFAPEQSFTIISTGIDNNDKKDKALLIYPNPANENIRISCDEKEIGNEIIITDLSGKAVMILKPGQASGLIDISQLKPGTYFIFIKDREYSPASLFVKHF